MNLQLKDIFYDTFLKEPTKDNLRKLLENNVGELDNFDLKENWIEKGSLVKIILAMANSSGGIIIFGVKENDDGTYEPIGIDSFKDKAEISNQISKYISPNLDYEILNYDYDTSDYSRVQNKKFQILYVHYTPERLPFVSLAETTSLEKDAIYVRRGTKCEKASSDELNNIIEKKISCIYKSSSDLSVEEHLRQLRILYNEIPEKIKVLVRKGKSSNLALLGFGFTKVLGGTPDEYREELNPNLPDENYEQFINRMINAKKLKIEKVLDLK